MTEQAIQALLQEPGRGIKEIAEIIKCDADAETKCKMISNILIAKPHYSEEQEPQCTEHPCLGTLCRYYKEPCDDTISVKIGEQQSE